MFTRFGFSRDELAEGFYYGKFLTGCVVRVRVREDFVMVVLGYPLV